MLTGRLKTCMGVLLGSAMVLLYAMPCSADDSASAGIEDMQRELRALKAEVESLRSDLSSGKEELKVQNDELLASKREFSQLTEQVRGLRQAEQEEVETLKDQIKREIGVVPNVYNDLSRKVRVGMELRTRGEYSNGFSQITAQGNAGPFSQVSGAGWFANVGGNVSHDRTMVQSRVRLNVDADVHEHLRAFFQLQDSRFWGIEGVTGGTNASLQGGAGFTNQNTLDMHQGYVDIVKLFDWPLTLRIGRQEIIWGDHRILGNFGWDNIANSWDGLRAMYDTERHAAEVIAIIRNHDRRSATGVAGATVNDADSDWNLYAGMWRFKKLVPNSTLELMYLLDHDQMERTSGETSGDDGGELEVHDVGFRLAGKVGKRIDYEAEYHEQFGEFRGQAHSARAGVVGGGYTFLDTAWTPRIGAEFNWSPGDGSGPRRAGETGSDSSKHRTFHNFYPTNHKHYGYMDMMAWKNMKGLRGQIKVKPHKKMVAWADIWSFWIDNVNDSWYNAGQAALRGFTGGQISAREPDTHLGVELDLTAKYELYKNVNLQAGYSRFFAGDYLDDTGPQGSDPANAGARRNSNDPDSDWAYLQVTVGF